MNGRSWLVRLLVCAASTASLASAQNPAAPASLLTPPQVGALVGTVPPPPAPNSDEDRADLAAVLGAQKARTPDTEAECKRDEHFTEHLFQTIYGNDRTRENSPRFYELMRAVLEATAEVNGAAKEKFRRKRPYQGHPEVVRELFSVHGYSYPSGHSMASFTLAMVLADLFPEQTKALLDRAGQIAQSRVEAGVHYPSDIKEGEVLGKATAAAILSQPAFQVNLAEVRAELKLPEKATN